MRKFKMLAAATLAAAAVMGMTVCAEGGSTYTTTENDVSVTITADQEEYEAGEEITFSIEIENNRKNWTAESVTVTYSNSDGIEGELPTEVPSLAYGESYTLEGTLTGDEATYPAVASSDTATSSAPVVAVVIAAVVVLAVLVVILIKKKKKTALALVVGVPLAAAAVIGIGTHALAAVADKETVTLRPYLKVTYAGQEVTLRAVLDVEMSQDLLKIDTEDRDLAQKITCHDPSIFKDVDGTYYIIGSFLAGGYSTDLRNWTSMDTTFQSTFTQEVRDQIRSYNKDENADDWNSYLWAPDIIYNTTMEKYCIYLSANGDDWQSNIVLLTSDSVTGPYDYVGTIVYGGFNEETYSQTDAAQVLGTSEIPERYVTYGVDNHKWGDMYPNCIDPCVFYDAEGNLWLSYGSWSGGIFMLALDEETGLRDYSVTYETDLHSDAYFGTKIAGGAYVSGEASYIQRIGDYYYLFISYGNLEAKGGYNIRVFRSETPDGGYVDEQGNTPYYDTYSFNYNTGVGVRLFGGYKWRNFTVGQVAQGHNSAFVDDDGCAYIVYHTRTTDGSEGHYVKVHQLFQNEEGWLVAAPYQTNGEKLEGNSLTAADIAGEYEVITHTLEIDYANLATNKPELMTLNEDGTVTGVYEGSWSYSDDGNYIRLTLDGEEYSGVALTMKIENTSIETPVFTVLGTTNQITIWGSKAVE